MSDVQIGDWRVWGAGAHRKQRGKTTEIEIDEDSLEVRVDEGSGYGAYSTTAYIPLEVLRAILAAAEGRSTTDE